MWLGDGLRFWVAGRWGSGWDEVVDGLRFSVGRAIIVGITHQILNTLSGGEHDGRTR